MILELKMVGEYYEMMLARRYIYLGIVMDLDVQIMKWPRR